MIAQTFDEVFSPPWINTHLSHPTHDLIILRQIIPWQSIIDGLVPFYNREKGRTGCALRTLSAVSILARLRQLSDRKVIEHIQENRYMQYFCNVPDPDLRTFMHPRPFAASENAWAKRASHSWKTKSLPVSNEPMSSRLT